MTRGVRPCTLKNAERIIIKQSQSCVRQQIKVVVIVSHRRTHAVAVTTPLPGSTANRCAERERVTGLVPKCCGPVLLGNFL